MADADSPQHQHEASPGSAPSDARSESATRPRAPRRIAATIGVVCAALIVVGGLGALAWLRTGSPGEGGSRGGVQPAAVEVAPVTIGRLEGRRAYSATLEARALVTVAPKVAGTITRLPVDLGDIVERGQVIAQLDSDEYAQASAQAEAELEVVRARLSEAKSAAEIAARELQRAENLHERGIASDADLDRARAEDLSARSAVAVAQAEVARARAALQASQIRLSYATIRADWEGGSDTRVISRRWAEEGDTVGANTRILSVVELDPIMAVFFATQRDYGRLRVGQAVRVTTDAFPGEYWQGEISRIAPVFDEASRQARIEVRVPNDGLRLKPGMFVRTEVVLDVAEDAAIVPQAAITRRDGQDLVFVLDPDGQTVRRAPITIVIDDGDRVAIEPRSDAVLRGARVVTLGHQLIDDGSTVVVPGAPASRAEAVSTDDTDADASGQPASGGGA